MDMNLDEAQELLKNAVKQSHLGNQPHIDLTLVSAQERPRYQYALMLVTKAIREGELDDKDFKHRVGLN